MLRYFLALSRESSAPGAPVGEGKNCWNTAGPYGWSQLLALGCKESGLALEPHSPGLSLVLLLLFSGCGCVTLGLPSEPPVDKENGASLGWP